MVYLFVVMRGLSGMFVVVSLSAYCTEEVL